MKRHSSSDSLGVLMSICPTSAEEHSPRNNHVYNREFQSMLDGLEEEGSMEEHCHMGEKKRRLSVDQVKALEKTFEIENKLEPERKVKLAQELGLQPRQVAVWFQNRRARWKTKQLERDYGLLKANYEALKRNFDTLQHDNDALLKEIKELKGKLEEEKTESNLSVKKETFLTESDNLLIEQTNQQLSPLDHHHISLPNSDNSDDFTYESFKTDTATAIATATVTAVDNGDDQRLEEVTLFADFKDGSSDSDSSAILNEDNNSPNCFPFQRSYNSNNVHHHHQHQFVKIEEHNFFSGEETCDLFADEQAPTLPWYCSDQWN